MKRFKRHKDYGFFDEDIRLFKPFELGDLLERHSKGTGFETFRGLLEKNQRHSD